MEQTKITKEKVLSGVLWRYAERMGVQIVGFVISLFLARLLSPEMYGVVAQVNIFVVILNVFVSSGLGTALIQKKDSDNVDFSTIFYFQIVFSVFLYVILFFCAPLIASFFNNQELVAVVRVLGLAVVLFGINNVQRAYVSKTLQYKRYFFSTLVGTVVSGIVGVILAFMGFGVWAIVIQTLTNAVLDILVLWFTVKWRPILKFSFSSLKRMVSFGWKLLISDLINNLYSNLYTIIIGKSFSAEDLGYYNKAYQFPNIIVSNLTGPIQGALLPAISAHQDDKERSRSMLRRAVKTTTYILFPMMMGMAAVAEPMVNLLVGEKWLPCVPMLQISCITLAFWPVQLANQQAINALGRSDIFLKLEIIKKAIGIAIIIFSIQYGLYAMLFGKAISSIIDSIINAVPNKKLLGYGYSSQIKDMLPSVLLSFVMGAGVYAITLFNLNMYVTLVIQILVGAVVYIVLSKLFRVEAFQYLWNMVREKRKK